MARGWESKTADERVSAAATAPRRAIGRKAPAPEVLEAIRKRETIALSRTRVVRELESVRNPRYRDQLTKALADLDKQLLTFAAH